MAKFKLTLVEKLPGDNIAIGESIILDVTHPTAIRTDMVREALKEQLGKRMTCGYSVNDRHWKVTKL